MLVAAGTGLAPFVSMARSRIMRDPRADLSDLVLLHGASYPADLAYRDELLGYQENNGACKAVAIPANAYATGRSYGRGWDCHYGFYKEGESCVEIVNGS